IRTYSLDTAKVGVVIALSSGLFGGLSTLFGGLIGDRMARHDERWLCWLSAIGLAVNAPLMILMLFQARFSLAAYFLFAASLFNGLHFGPVFGLVQTLVPMRMRALAASILLFVTNIVGMGMGPLFIGFASDSLGAAGVVEALGGRVIPAPNGGRLNWSNEYLVFAVREPFPSQATGTSIVYGTITPDSPLQITSHMGNNGVIFSDGIEADYLDFNHGSVATIGIAPHKVRLVVSIS
ncbi:MAG: hypothetical protein ACWGPN_16450, partial [Gammaproteobacteria bacterium]